MRFQSPLTAGQLKSVAYRYRGDLAAGRACAAAGRIRHATFWLAGGPPGATAETPTAGRRDHRLQRLEAVLFLTREPLTSRKLSQLANLADGTEARTLVRRLNELYDQEGRAFRVERVAGGYYLLTRPQLATWIRRLDHVPTETRLSAPAMETLAVVAYRQPVLRAEIEAVRGVSCDEILRQLMERNLVRIGGRSEELGRPYLYTTTKEFLRAFGLDSLDDLPRVETVKSGSNSHSDSPPGEQGDLHKSEEIDEDGRRYGQNQQKEPSMPVLTLPDLDADDLQPCGPAAGVAAPQLASTFGDDDEEEYDDFYDDEDDEDYEDEDYEDDEDYDDDDDLDGQWEEVDDDDDSEWEEDESDWGYDEDEEEDEEWD